MDDADRGRAARAGLIVLALLNLLNYLDRYVLPAVVESVKADLHLTDEQIGLLGTGFVVVLVITSPVFGMLTDRWSRTRLLSLGALLWSVATSSTALCRSFLHLFGARMAVGVGEAAYGTGVPSLLSDYFRPEVRGRVFAVFYAAIPLGTSLGYLAGGYINQELGWRHAFLLTGLPGLVLAWAAWRLWDPPRGSLDGAAAADAHAPPDWIKYKALLGNRIYRLTVLGYTAGTFALGGISFWMPTFLTRERGFSESDAAIVFGLVVGVASFIGSLGGGWLADWLLRWSKHAYLWLAGLTTLLAVPFCMLALVAPQRPVLLTAIFFSAMLLVSSTGPINVMLVNVVPAHMRGAAIALCTVSIHLLGDALSPPLIGSISDHSSLGRALLIVPVAVAVAGVIWTATAWNEGRRS